MEHGYQKAKKTFKLGNQQFTFFDIHSLEKEGTTTIAKLPFSIKVLLEAALRHFDDFAIKEEHLKTIANWGPHTAGKCEIPFKPARVVMQDFTGVPAVVDLAALRNAMVDMGGDPKKVNPQVPVDLVIDHSVQVDKAGSEDALAVNTELEFSRNQERYEFLKWGQESFDNFKVVPPATGIIHQVNLEFLAPVVHQNHQLCYPDSLVGTDSHTTMINGIGVVGWGVGGIEAEAVMLGQPIYMLLPEVIGFELSRELPEGATATDLVLTVVQMLRQKGVVGKFVEFYGSALKNLSLADRATLANMAPEYGATMGFFPVDEETLNYMKNTGRSQEQVELTKTYLKTQGMFLDANSPIPQFTDVLKLDISTIEPCVAGPKRPQDRIPLKQVKQTFKEALGQTYKVENKQAQANLQWDGKSSKLAHGSVVIAAITSCTNTSNPSVLIGAGLLAKKAVEKGLKVPAHVKTSLAPGSRVVTHYLDRAGLTSMLDALGFQTVGYGCTTCIGNSGPLHETITQTISENKLVVAGVLSGNRNFEGRIHASVQANYLASPALVVAYALAGTVDIDFEKNSLGKDKQGNPVFLKDLWPSSAEIRDVIQKNVTADIFKEAYNNVFSCNKLWNNIKISKGELYSWQKDSTYIRLPSFFEGITQDIPPLRQIKNAKVLALLGDSVTTDHISPAGSIAKDSPAGRYLTKNGISQKDWNSYGSRRGNHEVMMRGTFANIRIKNFLLSNVTGGMTKHLPSGKEMSIYDAAMEYKKQETSLVVIAGKEYGTGSSRDWAAKGTFLLGVKIVLAESFERIHRSNLIGMGVLPLQFKEGQSWKTLGLTGEEKFSFPDLDLHLSPGKPLTVIATDPSGGEKIFSALCRIDTPVEVLYYKNGGILNAVLRKMAQGV